MPIIDIKPRVPYAGASPRGASPVAATGQRNADRPFAQPALLLEPRSDVLHVTQHARFISVVVQPPGNAASRSPLAADGRFEPATRSVDQSDQRKRPPGDRPCRAGQGVEQWVGLGIQHHQRTHGMSVGMAADGLWDCARVRYRQNPCRHRTSLACACSSPPYRPPALRHLSPASSATCRITGDRAATE